VFRIRGLPVKYPVRLGKGCGSHGSRLNPRIKVDCSAAPGALPAQMPHANAQKAHIARKCGRRSSHESSHGSQAWARRIRHSK